MVAYPSSEVDLSRVWNWIKEAKVAFEEKYRESDNYQASCLFLYFNHDIKWLEGKTLGDLAEAIVAENGKDGMFLPDDIVDNPYLMEEEIVGVWREAFIYGMDIPKEEAEILIRSRCYENEKQLKELKAFAGIRY